MMTATQAAGSIAYHSYTVRAAEGLPSVRWTSEVSFDGRHVRIDVFRDGAAWYGGGTDFLVEALSYCSRTCRQRRRVARRLLGL